jgi:eukaryotic-like serine/threonine-protein kinase
MLDRATVRDLYSEAAALPAEERARLLERRCNGNAALRAEVESLLEALARWPSFLGTPTPALPAPTESPGTRLGPYRLLQEIGHGGFGAVYMAEQEAPVRRRVAVKVIKLGMDTRAVIARFEAERQALAMMDHAHIARVLDAGATESGRPFFVMELVRGDSITRYCDGHSLSVPERVDLFLQVCHAVQHAHSKGVIHRDLKPGNVLVETQDGRALAKVIDFGIAKAIEQPLTEQTLFTGFRQLTGTPEYMSPEQAEGSLDIDTRSDVYSLGVLLYELLTGATPLGPMKPNPASPAEVQQLIRAADPPKPSTRLSRSAALAELAARRRALPGRLCTMVRGDLDWIVMRALEKDRARRYETADALAADLRRHLAREPVEAAPPSAAYRLRRFVRRNRGPVIAGSLLVATLVLGVIGTSAGLVRSNAERRRAEQAKAFITSMLEAVKPGVARGEDTKLMRRVLNEAAARVDAGEAGDPLIEAELRHTIGAAYLSLGAPDVAGPMLLRAVELRTAALGPDDPATVNSLERLGAAQREAGLLVESEGTLRRVVDDLRRALGRHTATFDATNNLGVTLEKQGRFAEAEACFREAIEGLTQTAGAEHRLTQSAMYNLGFALMSRGRHREAEPLLRAALEARRRTQGDDAPATLLTLSTLGGMMSDTGRTDEAEPLLREALEGHRRVYGPDHPATLLVLNNMGMLMQAVKRPAEAEPYFREALEGLRRRFGDKHPSTLLAMQNLGSSILALGRAEEAEPMLRQAAEGARRSPALGERSARTYTAVLCYAGAERLLGKLEEAEALAREAHAGLARLLDPGHPWALNAASMLGKILQARGRPEEAEPLFQEFAQGRAKAFGPGHPHTLEAAAVYGSLLAELGRFVDAERTLLGALEAAGAAPPAPPAPKESRALIEALAGLHDRWHQAEPGAGHDAQASRWRGRLDTPPHTPPPAEK